MAASECCKLVLLEHFFFFFFLVELSTTPPCSVNFNHCGHNHEAAISYMSALWGK